MQEERLEYGLKNDYMFRAALQSNERVLRGLVCALLDLKEEEIRECRIENPIVLGEELDEKTCVLDVKILLNNEKRLNIELQTTNYKDWTDRSLLYLCRAFDDLPKGAKYTELKPTIHIGILDFSPFPEEKEFYAEYQLMNVKTHTFYNSKFILRVLNLTQIEQVSGKEKESDLYYWARLFRAESWEEIGMLAEKSEVLKEATVTLRRLNADERIRMQCEAQEKYEHDMASAYGCGINEGMERGIEQGMERGMEQGIARGIEAMILDNLEEGIPEERICQKLQKRFGVTEKEALAYVTTYAGQNLRKPIVEKKTQYPENEEMYQ